MTNREKELTVGLLVILSVIYVIGFFTVVVLVGTFISGMVVSAYYLEKESEEHKKED